MPVFNEQELIEKTANEVREFLEREIEDFELLLINDGSEDDTEDIIRGLEEEHACIRVINHETNKGYGRALATGFQEASKDLIFYTDSDGQFDIRELKTFLEEIDEDKMVVGFREDRKDSFDRLITSEIFNRLSRFLLPIDVKDIDCAFKLLDAEILEDMNLKTQRTVDAELLAKSSKNGVEIKQRPVTHRERIEGDSEAEGFLGVRLSLIIKSIQELIQIRRDLK